MIKQKDHLATLRQAALAGVALGALLTVPTYALAQEADTAPDADTTPAAETTPVAEKDAKAEDKIVVTGSRIRRSEFTSISPIQVISGEISRDLGLIEADEILRQTSVVLGQQNDIGVSTVLQGGLGQAFTTFGTVTPSLRGLASSVTGRSRTLILVNDRRLGPVGVGGAPANPDVSIIPGSLIQRTDILLDGASSIYGSDAIAGVINYKLRTDVEGLELNAFYDNSQVGENKVTLSAITGMTTDRGHIIIAGEYRNTSGYRRIDRFPKFSPFIDSDFGPQACQPEREINTNTGEVFSGCASFLADFAVFGPLGTVVVTPGTSNIGVPGYSRLGTAPFNGPDSNGTFGSINNPFTRSHPQDQQALVNPKTERLSIYSLGEYDTHLPTDLTAYYELSFAERNLQTNSFGQGVIEVTGNTPFNPGIGGTLLVPLLEFETDQVVNTFRATGGIKGNLNFLEKIGLNNWTYDAYGLFHQSRGINRTFGDLNNINTARVLNGSVDANNQFQCALDESIEGTQPTRRGTGGFTTSVPNCFAVNFFDQQFLTSGRFSDPAANDLILATAIQNTNIEQITGNAFITGDLFDIPGGGTIQAVLGTEYRYDKVSTINDFNQSTPQALASSNPDVGSQGNRYLYEFYGELVLPLIEDKPFVKSLQLELAGRLINEQFFGSGETYQIKGQWKPLDWLQLSAGYGTSFRAPDTGEQFGTGIAFNVNTRSDPCLPSTNVLADIDGDGIIDYDFAADERSARTISLCNQLGVITPQPGDTLAEIQAAAQALGLFGIGTPSGSFQNFAVLRSNAGNTGISPESSNALFLKASIDQPWFDQFSLRASVNYFEYEVNDSIGQLTSGLILSTCINDPNTTVVNGALVGDLCQFQTRSPTTGLITAVNESSFNLGSLTSQGMDINVEFGADLTFVKKLPILDKLSEVPFLGVTYRATRQFQNNEDVSGDGTFDHNLGEFGFAKFQQNITTRLRYKNWTVLHRFTYSSATDSGLAPFGGGNVCRPTLLARDPNADVSGCTEHIILPNVKLHSLTMVYNADVWTLRAGVTNLFNTVPILDTSIPGDGGTGTPFGLGYDADGRNVFFNIARKF
ncbi:MAG: hypothetical protein COA84_09215 [Robiginitomaculum sp.]|nr:MAG: hypothetical protein COA84_09215 [Robiginitomaculum sp.]